MSAAAVPALDDAVRSPTPEEVAGFRRDGHVLVRGLASAAEVESYRELVVTLARAHAWDRRPLAERDTYGRAFLQAGNLWERDPRIARFSHARRFARVAAELLGVDGLRLYHDQALLKEPGGGHTPWHQDQHYWPFADDTTITMWMPLVPVDPSMGLMRFASGSQRAGDLGGEAISDASQVRFDELVATRGWPVWETPALAPGDATFHRGWTLHGSPGNPTDRLRAAMTIIWFADGMRMVEPDRPARRLDAAIWLPGVAPGEPAASPRNPVVWARR